MTAMDEMCALLTSWGMDPAQIPEDGLYLEGYETFAPKPSDLIIRTGDGRRLRHSLTPYPEGFPYMQAMEIYERHLEERRR